ncbi:hypothetical protein GALMADRAFT_116184 [Galerina marginata CBS 339.88]|uniref:Transmembrane protein n=1 Tax=Galerina marginata (strain CBS 339.88) TaxID=685588 RepID=A0A067TD70_GALM3|nr:hypothetical protein GALMADRAFT_116184 [Galerina marginata CBS 339.88]
MSIPTRWVMVDDTDPGIKYTGPWNLTLDTQNDMGDDGPLFNGTSHGVNVNGNRADFSFSGSRLIIYGTSKAQLLDANFGTIDPSWDCFVDGNGLNSSPPTFTIENNWILCEIDSLSDGPHTVGVTARVSSPNNPFSLDRYQYVPSASVALDNATIYVNSTDAAVQFGSGWTPFRNHAGSMTQQNGAKVTFDFVGVQISWVSSIPNTTSTQSAPATYSIDGGTPVSFQLAGLENTSTEKNNQILFQTPALSPGKHHIEVVHGGNLSTTPLSLVYIVVQNATVPASSASGTLGLPSNTASPNQGSGPHSTTKSKTPIGAIAGGVVGGILAIVALIFLILFLRRRVKKGKATEGQSTPDLAARQPTIEPFNAFPSGPAAYQLPSSSSTQYVPQTTGKGALAALTPKRYAPPPPPSGARSPDLSLGSGASETKGQNGAVVSAGSEGVISSQSGSGSGQDPAPLPVRVLRHEDSGVRLPESEEIVVELPPLYTPG